MSDAMDLDLTEFCNACHHEFDGTERRWRFSNEHKPDITPQTIPHFCEKCAPRCGFGAMVEVLTASQMAPSPTKNCCEDK